MTSYAPVPRDRAIFGNKASRSTWRGRRGCFRPTVGMPVMACVLSIAATASAGQLIYQPVNPAFGGNPLNSATIQNQATDNNFRYTQPKSSAANTAAGSSTQQFSTEITSALLSQVASQIGNEIIGPNAKNSGTFSVGGQIIQFNRAGGQININLTDSGTGGTTNIQIPVPSY